jgi:hypothetical protein
MLCLWSHHNDNEVIGTSPKSNKKVGISPNSIGKSWYYAMGSP